MICQILRNQLLKVSNFPQHYIQVYLFNLPLCLFLALFCYTSFWSLLLGTCVVAFLVLSNCPNVQMIVSLSFSLYLRSLYICYAATTHVCVRVFVCTVCIHVALLSSLSCIFNGDEKNCCIYFNNAATHDELHRVLLFFFLLVISVDKLRLLCIK